MRKKLMIALTGLSTLGAVPAAAETATHYNLTVEVRPGLHSIRVYGSWSVPATEVVADLGQNPGEKHFRFLSSEKLHEFRLSIAGSAVSTKCRPFEGQLECLVSFKAETKPEYTFEISYVSDGKAAPQLRIDADQAFAGSSGDYWYPQLSYAKGDTGEIRFVVPKNFTVVAPGRLIRQSAEGDVSEFSYRLVTPTKFGFAAAPFHIYDRGLCKLYLQREEPRAAHIADECARTALALSHIWGPLPGGDIKLVEVAFKSVLLGIGERGYILADSSEIHRDFDISYWAHEISHQWWGNLVRAAYPSPGGTLLTEGMAEFGALSANRDLNGKDGEAYYLSDHYAREANGAPMYHFMTVIARHEDIALTAMPQGADASALHYVATSKGTMAIDMLSNEVGASRFRTICSEFLKTHANKSVTWAEFEAFVERRSGKVLGWFFAQWFDRPGLPFLYSTWTKHGDGIDITLHQCGPQHYRMDRFPFLLRSENEKGDLESRVVFGDVSGIQTTFHVQTKSDIYRVNPDPDHTFFWMPGICG